MKGTVVTMGLKLALGAVGVAVIATILALSHQRTARLREEGRALELQVEQLAPAPAGNLRPTGPVMQASDNAPAASDQYRELLRLRSEVDALRQEKAEAEKLRAENRQFGSGSAGQDWRAALTTDQLLQTYGYGPKASQEIAGRYSEAWLKQFSNPSGLIRLGMALYDVGRYSDALTVFREMEKSEAYKGVGFVWQGHMLDLLGRREEALAAYKQVAGRNLHVRHDNYGIQLTKEYIQERIERPFVRVENHWED
jgi:tetratricopeptide (TPR) repeat protein